MKEMRYNSVAVLYGGPSAEREISIQSGRAISEALRAKDYRVTELDTQHDHPDIPEQVEAVFIALHGATGEDGRIQAHLQELAIPYTGTKAADMPDSFDKILTKRKLESLDIPTAPWAIVHEGDACPLELPVVIKPPREGSSIGIEIIFEPEQWAPGLARSLASDSELMVEKYIPGREFTVSLLNGELLPPIEIIPEEGNYDFEAKYVSGTTHYEVPAQLNPEENATILEHSRAAFEAFRCKNLGRVDFRMTSAGEFYMLEMNTIPGFTATSLLPKAAAAVGIPFEEVCFRIMEAASL